MLANLGKKALAWKHQKYHVCPNSQQSYLQCFKSSLMPTQNKLVSQELRKENVSEVLLLSPALLSLHLYFYKTLFHLSVVFNRP